VKVQEGEITRHLRSRHVLWLHGWVMGLLTLGVMWLATAALRHGGVQSLAVRYTAVLGVGYLVYLLLLRVWAGMLVSEEAPEVNMDDLYWPDGGGRGGGQAGDGCHGGGAGDVGDAGSALGDVASGALEAAGAADEGAIVIIPVLAVFTAVVAMLLGAGCLLLAYFGTEALLAASVELAFAYTVARTAVRVEREGWLLAAIRLTWKPLLGALVSAVLLGALVDHFAPQAHTLPEAVRWWRGR
jgi:hypothetical protein